MCTTCRPVALAVDDPPAVPVVIVWWAVPVVPELSCYNIITSFSCNTSITSCTSHPCDNNYAICTNGAYGVTEITGETSSSCSISCFYNTRFSYSTSVSYTSAQSHNSGSVYTCICSTSYDKMWSEVDVWNVLTQPCFTCPSAPAPDIGYPLLKFPTATLNDKWLKVVMERG